MVILAVPVGSMASLVSAALEAGLPDGSLITDVGSVKCVPHRKIPPLLKGRDIHFIGSHPMAGSERNGLSAITDSLFQNAACLLTNDNSAPPEVAAALERFWKSIGCRTSWMAAAVHDELVARISHLPHILSASTARVCLKDPAEGRFGGGGLRDTTRVAGGNPTMWAEIVMENREALTDLLKETITDLRLILSSLESGHQEQTLQWLELAKDRRNSLYSPCSF
ncbi:MAG: prephenate dehydrogenase/arogenate dehydrogenase family protein [Akkermansiaceae bacterium]|nr:prephenate dehydrogenase/arogenate dehydrogenase family protein [Akkermansiaceae bacterium]